MTIKHEPLTDLNKPAETGNLWIERVGCWVLTPERIVFTPEMRRTVLSLRIGAGLTQAELAASIGMSREWLRNLETGTIAHIISGRYNAIIDACSDAMHGTVAA